ncbi:CLUMA_CG012902, isoform A [Clunio marinus]|uniref:CLUMA_CG012902, isoform A n=1 Tax=Clunio marinus TaxID=568069 RepID=A0A1J1IKI5_9DIPT|nr:CLUMA_CG012902, isoform A [Clunio marinus]
MKWKFLSRKRKAKRPVNPICPQITQSGMNTNMFSLKPHYQHKCTSCLKIQGKMNTSITLIESNNEQAKGELSNAFDIRYEVASDVEITTTQLCYLSYGLFYECCGKATAFFTLFVESFQAFSVHFLQQNSILLFKYLTKESNRGREKGRKGFGKNNIPERL